MQSSQDIETTFKSAERNPALCVREIRSIDWLSRSNETLIRIGRPAPSDEQLLALRAAGFRFLARFKQVRLEVFRMVGRQTEM